MPLNSFPTAESDTQYHKQDHRSVDNIRLAILMLLGAEMMLFGGLVSGFLVFRIGSITWPPPAQAGIRLSGLITGLNAVVLLLSGYTMFQALRAIRRNSPGKMRNWLLITALLGMTFLAVQGSEWMRLIRFGLTLSSGIYGSIFYVLIGCHAVHVLGAVVWLIVVFIMGLSGRFSASHHIGVEVCTLYWLFVVALWPLLYVLVYLI